MRRFVVVRPEPNLQPVDLERCNARHSHHSLYRTFFNNYCTKMSATVRWRSENPELQAAAAAHLYSVFPTPEPSQITKQRQAWRIRPPFLPAAATRGFRVDS